MMLLFKHAMKSIKQHRTNLQKKENALPINNLRNMRRQMKLVAQGSALNN